METSHAWWEYECPLSNVGIRTGPESGLVVLDIDPDKGGEASLRHLEAQHRPLPETATVLSGRRRRHPYFQHPGGLVPATSGKLGSGLDTRSDTLASLAGTMRARGMTYDSILAALLVENRRCDPPLPEGDVKAVAQSISKYNPQATPLLDLGVDNEGNALAVKALFGD